MAFRLSLKRLPRWPVVALLLLLPAPAAAADQARGGGQSRTAATSSDDQWSIWLANTVNFVRLVEVIVLLAGVYQLWARRDERRKAEEEAARLARKTANYEAWQVINSAQGKGGSGGRIDALQDLIQNGISLAGVRLDGAWLEGAQLGSSQLRHASLREANLQGADLKEANLENVDFTDANLTGADLRGAHMKGAILKGTQLGTADLRGADLTGLRDWQAVKSASYLNIDSVRNAPPNFRDWMITQGAVDAHVPPPDDIDQTFSTVWRAV